MKDHVIGDMFWEPRVIEMLENAAKETYRGS